ncbi:bacteriocin secretion accessory protein [Listeria booriae]|uniref:Bacteriocin secretion accessory protein n=1 Tax=Listeria booriae TaxID=1552123 RepID=A0A842AUY0_9LIST|nr:bacteriocin secretion accessory protein [Listeria booriae]MBC1795444.1 bacteriocin secretion accessory protein [Listeria booriae]
MDTRLLESSEFYQRKYKNFSTLIIVPILCLFIFIMIFSIFCTKELTIKLNGEIQPTKIVTKIQSTSSSTIIENNLSENKLVKKGDMLIAYNNTVDSAQLANFKKQLDIARQQESQINLLKAGIEKEMNTFDVPDFYGYSRMLDDYLKQAENLRLNAKKENEDILKQNQSILNVKASIKEEILNTNKKINEYNILKKAVNNNSNLDRNHSLYAMYNTYKKQYTVSNEDSAIKNQFVTEVEKNIDQLKNSVATLKTQQASAGTEVSPTTSLESQLDILKSQQSLNASKEFTTVKSKIDELETNITMQEQLFEKGKIYSPANGIIHVNEDTKGNNTIPEGTIIAELYPPIEEQGNVTITTYVPSQDITSVYKGDTVRFTTRKDASESITLNCKVTSIDSSPTRTKTGNYFKVSAQTKVSTRGAAAIRYGTEGTFLLITGKKSYFNFYKDKLFNNK